MRVVLTAPAASHIHHSLAPWCLKAYAEAKGFTGAIRILELTANDLPDQAVAAIIAENPDLLGFSCYIWNITFISIVAAAVKKLRPDVTIILGGPEVSFERDLSAFPFADAIIAGPGETLFWEYLQQDGKHPALLPPEKPLLPFAQIPSPYTQAFFDAFGSKGMGHRLVYYEGSRGCIYRCSYCLSSLTCDLETLPLERVFADLALLASRGARRIKCVDRTFNADPDRTFQLLAFIKHLQTNCVFHFEAAPDLFNEETLQLINSMPIGRVQLEMGIQSVNPKTLTAVLRTADIDQALSAIARISQPNNVHTHVDLIAGLPYETPGSFREAVNRCLAARPHTLQIGFLKLLKGSALTDAAKAYGLLACDHPPYEVMQTDTLTYCQMRNIKAVEEVLDKYYNSGLFTQAVRLGMDKLFPDAYTFFAAFADYIGDLRKPKTSLKEAYGLLCRFLIMHGGGEEAKESVKRDIFSHSDKAMLPDILRSLRDPAREMAWMQKNARVRIERFAFDGVTRVYDLNTRHPVTGEYLLLEEKP